MTNYVKVYKLTLRLIDFGIFPGPTVINRNLGRDRPPYNRQLNKLNGEETKARAAALKARGFVKDERNGRWKLP